MPSYEVINPSPSYQSFQPSTTRLSHSLLKKRAIEESQYWWYCDNILNHPGQCGLLRMQFPRVFILIRDEDTAYWADYEEWKNDIVEVNFFTPSEREEADIDSILTEAWNFLVLIEEEEERQYEEDV